MAFGGAGARPAFHRNMTDLVRYSIDLYSRLEEETGQQVGWINKGSLSIATNRTG